MEHTIFIVSGGAGASGEQLVQTVLAQFPDNQVRVRLVPHVRFPGQLIQLRQIRQRSLGVPEPSDYTNPEKVMVELQAARQFCRQNGFSLVEVTDKPIESSADEIIRLISSRLKPSIKG